MTYRKRRPQGTRSARAPAGFTIIEILVALTLLAIVILLVTRAFLTVLSVTSQGGRLTVATALAAKKLESVRTQVEAQPDRDSWRREFCEIEEQLQPKPFDAPYAAYSYRVLKNERAVAAAPGQEELLLPCWSVEEGTRGGCTQGYNPECALDKSLDQEDRLRWVTVEVYFRGGNAPVVRMTTAIMRGAYHRTD